MSKNKRALISVYDKTGLEKFARELVSLGYDI
jgi:AICAR transformylase/IMP cyclohydrolase PurH